MKNEEKQKRDLNTIDQLMKREGKQKKGLLITGKLVQKAELKVY